MSDRSEKEKMVWWMERECLFETDSKFIAAAMSLQGYSQDYIQDWQETADKKFREQMSAMASCPDGCMAIWGEEEVIDHRISVPLTAVMLAGNTLAGGLLLRVENDVISDSDAQYTHGMEVLWLEDATMRENALVWEGFGLRHLMYTPEDITIAEPQPDDRPWAGLSAAVYERWSSEGHQRSEWMVGVVGDWAGAESIQTWAHEDVFSGREPRGWSNQVPNEVVANYTIEVYKPLWVVGTRNSWCADVTQTYGGSLGTAFVNAEAGGFLRAGWAVPKEYRASLIKPTFRAPRWYGYLHLGAEGRAVLHNVTLGGSLFQDGPSREMRSFVLDTRAGATVGVKDFKGWDVGMSYSVVQRSPEFVGQSDPVDYGAVALSVIKVY